MATLEGIVYSMEATQTSTSSPDSAYVVDGFNSRQSHLSPQGTHAECWSAIGELYRAQEQCQSPEPRPNKEVLEGKADLVRKSLGRRTGRHRGQMGTGRAQRRQQGQAGLRQGENGTCNRPGRPRPRARPPCLRVGTRETHSRKRLTKRKLRSRSTLHRTCCTEGCAHFPCARCRRGSIAQIQSVPRFVVVDKLLFSTAVLEMERPALSCKRTTTRGSSDYGARPPKDCMVWPLPLDAPLHSIVVAMS